MERAPLLNETALDLLIAVDFDAETRPSEAIVDAFLAADVDVYGKSTVLEDWIDTDVLDGLADSASDAPFYISARIWGHRLVLTPGRLRIYGETLPPPDSTARAGAADPGHGRTKHDIQ